jgi:chitinase
MANAHRPLDFVNLMTYDFHGPWTSHTGHHANLYPPAAPDSVEQSAAHAVTQFVKAGVPPEKLVLGVPFYGRGWSGVKPENEGLYQPYEASQGSYSYDTLANHLAQQENFVRQWDAAAQAPTLWNADSSLLITYETPASLRAKAHFVKSRGLGGVMYWEHNADDGTLLRTLYDHLR